MPWRAVYMDGQALRGLLPFCKFDLRCGLRKSLSQMNVQGTLPLVNTYQSTNAGGFKKSFCAKIGTPLPGHPLMDCSGQRIPGTCCA
jgi:hypothetical protein